MLLANGSPSSADGMGKYTYVCLKPKESVEHCYSNCIVSMYINGCTNVSVKLYSAKDNKWYIVSLVRVVLCIRTLFKKKNPKENRATVIAVTWLTERCLFPILPGKQIFPWYKCPSLSGSPPSRTVKKRNFSFSVKKLLSELVMWDKHVLLK